MKGVITIGKQRIRIRNSDKHQVGFCRSKKILQVVNTDDEGYKMDVWSCGCFTIEAIKDLNLNCKKKPLLWKKKPKLMTSRLL